MPSPLLLIPSNALSDRRFIPLFDLHHRCHVRIRASLLEFLLQLVQGSASSCIGTPGGGDLGGLGGEDMARGAFLHVLSNTCQGSRQSVR